MKNHHRKSHREIVECAGIALTNNRRVFLIRPFYAKKAQSFAIPKGHVNTDEDIRDAAIREFKEETGIDLSRKPIKELTHVYTKISPNKVKRVTVFEVKGTGKEKFISSIDSDCGCPESIYGEYFPFEIARDFITGYQVPIIEKLSEDDMSSLSHFYIRRKNHD